MTCLYDCGATLSAILWLFGLAVVGGVIAYRWPWTAIPLAVYIMFGPGGRIMHGFPSGRDQLIAWSGVAIPLLVAGLSVARRRLSRSAEGPA